MEKKIECFNRKEIKTKRSFSCSILGNFIFKIKQMKTKIYEKYFL